MPSWGSRPELQGVSGSSSASTGRTTAAAIAMPFAPTGPIWSRATLRKLLLPGGGGLKTLDRLPLVWERLDEVNERLGVRPLSVFLDYDGTLSPIVDDYRKATIAEETRAAVARLAERYPVAVISGARPGGCARARRARTHHLRRQPRFRHRRARRAGRATG